MKTDYAQAAIERITSELNEYCILTFNDLISDLLETHHSNDDILKKSGLALRGILHELWNYADSEAQSDLKKSAQGHRDHIDTIIQNEIEKQGTTDQPNTWQVQWLSEWTQDFVAIFTFYYSNYSTSDSQIRCFREIQNDEWLQGAEKTLYPLTADLVLMLIRERITTKFRDLLNNYFADENPLILMLAKQLQDGITDKKSSDESQKLDKIRNNYRELLKRTLEDIDNHVKIKTEKLDGLNDNIQTLSDRLELAHQANIQLKSENIALKEKINTLQKTPISAAAAIWTPQTEQRVNIVVRLRAGPGGTLLLHNEIPQQIAVAAARTLSPGGILSLHPRTPEQVAIAAATALGPSRTLLLHPQTPEQVAIATALGPNRTLFLAPETLEQVAIAAATALGPNRTLLLHPKTPEQVAVAAAAALGAGTELHLSPNAPQQIKEAVNAELMKKNQHHSTLFKRKQPDTNGHKEDSCFHKKQAR